MPNGFFTKLKEMLLKVFQGKPDPEPQAAAAPTVSNPVPEATLEIPNRPQFVAAVAAAIATAMGTDVSGLRIRSIRPLSGQVGTPVPAASMEIFNRPQFVAAVATAIATAMDTDVSGLRIHSIRPLFGEARAVNSGERSRFVAAIAASIAACTGTEAFGLRIHSIKRI